MNDWKRLWHQGSQAGGGPPDCRSCDPLSGYWVHSVAAGCSPAFPHSRAAAATGRSRFKNSQISVVAPESDLCAVSPFWFVRRLPVCMKVWKHACRCHRVRLKMLTWSQLLEWLTALCLCAFYKSTCAVLHTVAVWDNTSHCAVNTSGGFKRLRRFSQWWKWEWSCNNRRAHQILNDRCYQAPGQFWYDS